MLTLEAFPAEAQAEDIRPLHSLLTDVAEKQGIRADQLFEYKVAVSEALADVIRQAYRGEPPAPRAPRSTRWRT